MSEGLVARKRILMGNETGGGKSVLEKKAVKKMPVRPWKGECDQGSRVLPVCSELLRASFHGGAPNS